MEQDHQMYAPYKKSYRSMRSIAEAIQVYQKKCGDLPADLRLQDFLSIEKCPDGALLGIDKPVKSVDEWKNSIFLKRTDAGISLLSCGAEWIEVKLDKESNFIGSLYNNGKVIPYNKGRHE